MDALTTEIDVGNVTVYEVVDLSVGTTYICRAKAYDASGNISDFSSGAFGEVKIQPPGGFKTE
jgi:hypothetical protein